MKTSRPYKDKPWILMDKPSFWERLFYPNARTRMYIDTQHPEWIKQVLIPTINELKNAK